MNFLIVLFCITAYVMVITNVAADISCYLGTGQTPPTGKTCDKSQYCVTKYTQWVSGETDPGSIKELYMGTCLNGESLDEIAVDSQWHPDTIHSNTKDQYIIVAQRICAENLCNNETYNKQPISDDQPKYQCVLDAVGDGKKKMTCDKADYCVSENYFSNGAWITTKGCGFGNPAGLDWKKSHQHCGKYYTDTERDSKTTCFCQGYMCNDFIEPKIDDVSKTIDCVTKDGKTCTGQFCVLGGKGGDGDKPDWQGCVNTTLSLNVYGCEKLAVAGTDPVQWNNECRCNYDSNCNNNYTTAGAHASTVPPSQSTPSPSATTSHGSGTTLLPLSVTMLIIINFLNCILKH